MRRWTESESIYLNIILDISLCIYIYVDIHVKIDLGIILIDYMDLLLSPSC